MTTAVQASNILDRLYEKGARLAGTISGSVRKYATEQPGGFRRGIVLCVGALLFMVAGHLIIGPVLTDIGDHVVRSQYADKCARLLHGPESMGLDADGAIPHARPCRANMPGASHRSSVADRNT